MKRLLSFMCLAVFIPAMALADIKVPMYLTSTNESIGTITLRQTSTGLAFIPNLHHLPPGTHGFHVHEHATCASHGEAAGGHLDPQHTGKHLGPYNNQGHLGDLPALVVRSDGVVVTPVVAPRLTIKDVVGHALMIHEGGDNYSDQPQKLGGGGKRLACGPIPAK